MNKQRISRRYDSSIFVDDGGIDAWEFDSNFIHFDSRDPLDAVRAWGEAESLWALRSASESARGTSLRLRPLTLHVERRSA